MTKSQILKYLLQNTDYIDEQQQTILTATLIKFDRKLPKVMKQAEEKLDRLDNCSS